MKSGVDKRQARALRLQLQQMPKRMTEGVRKAVKDGAETLKDEMEEGYRGVRRSGNLEEQVGIQFRSNGLEARVGFPGKRRRKRSFYAMFLEFGTRKQRALQIQATSLQRKKNQIADKLDQEVDKALDTFARG